MLPHQSHYCTSSVPVVLNFLDSSFWTTTISVCTRVASDSALLLHCTCSHQYQRQIVLALQNDKLQLSPNGSSLAHVVILGASAFRQYLNAWMKSSKDLILASMACR